MRRLKKMAQIPGRENRKRKVERKKSDDSENGGTEERNEVEAKAETETKTEVRKTDKYTDCRASGTKAKRANLFCIVLRVRESETSNPDVKTFQGRRKAVVWPIRRGRNGGSKWVRAKARRTLKTAQEETKRHSRFCEMSSVEAEDSSQKRRRETRTQKRFDGLLNSLRKARQTEKIKRTRAQGGCQGTDCRRRTR